MPRVASTLLLAGGAIVLMAWVVRPASSLPQPSESAPSVDAPVANTLSTITAEADALHDRLDARPPYRAPTRDPFTYGAMPASSARSTLVPTPARDTVSSVPLPPSLVAILVNDTSHGPTRRAVFSIGDDVAIHGVGDVVGRWRVMAIDVDRVTMADASGRSVDVRLR
jgi:hypothetical protein